MELSDIIPKKYKHLDNWKIKSNTLMFKNYQYTPLCFISDDNDVYIYLDLKLKKQIIELIKHLMCSKVNFYLTIPDLSNPSGVADIENKVITNYLKMYANLYFYTNFNKINFDLIKNMVDWTIKNNCYDLIKDNFDKVSKEVNRKSFDYWSSKDIYEYPEDIRKDFQTLYREIQINQIID